MDFEKYTDRAKGFVQAAQSLALREGHQQFGTDHLLKVLLDDPEGMAAGLIQRAGGRPGDALAAVERPLAKRPKVSGGGAGQVYLAPELARVFDAAEKIADKAGDKFVTVERLLLALAMEAVAAMPAARSRRPASRRPRSIRPSTTSARAAPQTAPRPSRPTMRSSAMPAISPRRPPKARSIPSSAATRRSAAPSRCCPGAPRTIRC